MNQPDERTKRHSTKPSDYAHRTFGLKQEGGVEGRACGTALWLFIPEWPELIHPFASAIETMLPVPPAHAHVMLAFKAPWVEVTERPGGVALPAISGGVDRAVA